MRIIAGEFRSRKLISPPEEVDTRPLPDRVKESIFSILRGNIEGAVIFDGFAGTGAFGLEALSRGAARCVFVEKDKRMAGVLQDNIGLLGVRDRSEVVVGDVLGPGALSRCPRPVDMVFLDPPYPLMRDRLGSTRIKAQLGLLGGCLSEAGFALLRTPWPLLLATEDPEQAADHSHGKGKGKGKHRGDQGESLQEERPTRSTARPRVRDDDSRGGWQEVWSINKGGPIDLYGDFNDVGDEDAPDSDDADGTDADGTEETAAKHTHAQPSPIELVIEQLRGPETHEYSGMAVHFYMNRKPG